MKSNVTKEFILQAENDGRWFPVCDYPETAKNQAISLLKYKKKTNKGVKWRVIQRIVKEKKIA